MSESKTPGRTVAFGLVGIVMMLILPVPPFFLDIFLAVSITVALLVFLLAVNFGNPVEFSTFPSVLLVATVLRLSLNIASTRLILLHGHDGIDAAGRVIRSFGAFVVGGSYVVGIIVFIILVIINFKVITAGASRISEVAARFTLDAMPGKQMAIDNDLANGHITEEQARSRRKAISDEADFYGAMDGANKFVKGDAVAGLIITIVNIVGGIVIGVAQQGLGFAEAAQTYTILTVGDGLVSQIPALLVSTAAGLIAARTAAGEELGHTLSKQLIGRPEPLFVAAISLGILAIVPGMPTVPFLALAAGAGALAARARRKEQAAEAPEPAGPKRDPDQEVPLHDLLRVDLLALEVGFDLVPLVDRKRGGELLKRIKGIRKQLAPELGLVVPPIHVRDNLRLAQGAYRLMLSGTAVAEGEVKMGRLLAIDPGGALGKLAGDRTTDPAFGMPAVWVPAGDRERAEVLGYTVVDPATVVATHMTEVLKRHAAELLGRTEAQELVDSFGQTHQKLVEEVIPTLLPLGEVIKVLKNLLREGVSIRDMRTILEAIADNASQVKEPEALTELVRAELARQLSSRYAADDGTIGALVLAPDVEAALRALSRGGGADPGVLNGVVKGLETALAQGLGQMTEPLVLTAPDVRRSVATLAARHAPGLAVLSFKELDPKVNVKTVGLVTLAA